jgi:uncharacterized membrane protein (DUF485 family)
MPVNTINEATGYRHWTGGGGLIAAGVGAAALTGLLLKIPVLASLGPGKIPMAPSTALLFLLYGATVFLRTYWPQNRSLHCAGLLIHIIGAAVTLILFFLSSHHIHLAAERLGVVLEGTIAGVPKGHMSPLTALCFLLASLSYSASLSLMPRRPIQMPAAFWSASLLLATSFILLLAYLYGSPLLYHSGFIPPAATTSVAFLALAVALLLLAAPATWHANELSSASTRNLHILLAVFLILSAGIITSGYVYYRKHTAHFRDEVKRKLLAVAELKAGELERWRAERLGNGAIFLITPTLPDWCKAVLRRLQAPRMRRG